MKRRILFTFIVSILFIFSIYIDTTKVLAHENDEPILSDYFQNVVNSVNDYQLIYQTVRLDKSILLKNDCNIYDDNYAGAFIDDNGMLNIALVETNSLENCSNNLKSKIQNLSLINGIIYQYYKFSYNYLQQVLNDVEKVMVQYNISSAGIDDELNKVFIETSINNEDEIMKYLVDNNGYSSNALVFYYDENLNIDLNSKAAYSGGTIFTWINSTTIEGGTIGANAVCNDTGQIGVLTNAHVAPLETIRNYGGDIDFDSTPPMLEYNDLLGNSIRALDGDNVDAAFVHFQNQENWEISPYSKHNTTIYDNIKLGSENQIVRGQPILRIGQVTGITTGVIRSANVSMNINNSIKSNLFRYTNSGLDGDSGGPVYYNDGTNLYLLGLHFATGEVLWGGLQGYACRMLNVMSQLNVTPITNDSFNTTILSNDTIRLNSINFNPSGVFVIPSNLNGRIVSELGIEVLKDKNLITKIIIPNTITKIGARAFKNCTSLQSITLSSSLEEIGASAFKGCTSLSSITIPNTVTSIDDSAFENCTSLQSITLSSSLEEIGASAFKGCTSLSSITIPNTVTSIGDGAFENCTSLQSITLSSSLEEIGASAFKGCTSLSSITIPNTVTSIDDSAFENCTSLQSITLSSSLEEIGASAFKGCTSLGEIQLPSNLQNIGNSAFYNCTNLNSVIVNRDKTVTTNLGNYVFNGCSSLLQIVVPQNRVAEYKNKTNWSNYSSIIIPNNNTFEEINLNCSVDGLRYTFLNAGNNKLYKLDVDCSKSYRFTTDLPTNIIIYNSNMDIIYDGESTVTAYLSKAVFYLSVELVSPSISQMVSISYRLAWPLTATLNNNLNILNYLHLIDTNTYHCVINFNNTYGEKLFKFKLDAGNNATYSAGAIKVYTDSALTNQLDRYFVSGLTYPASSNAKENELYVFLPENGTYYIEITVPRNDYNSLQFLVSNVDEMSIDYLSTLATSTNTSVFSYKTEASYFKKVDISHKSKIKIELNSNTGCFNSTKLFIFKLNKDPGYDIGVNHYSLASILQVNLIFDENSYNNTIILDEGTYYIGYTNNINCSLNLSLRRLINGSIDMDGTLVADPYPNQGYTIGSEVLLNGGSYNNYNITEGFTRCIYLMVDDILLEPNSRLAYDWYSSNDDIAIVTQYGTVLAKPVDNNTNVTIYAILKEDPSVVYRKTFTILNDALTYDILPINIYVNMTVLAGDYTPIDLSNTVVPINMLQYYSWDITQGGSVDRWGNVYANEASLGNTLYITGDYIYNERVKIFINAFVIESTS